MFTHAFFINPTGKILDIGSTKHITYIVDYPEKFGYTKEELKSIYEKYGEHFGTEGKAREEIIEDITRKGFVHIRQYRNYWAINFYDLNSRTRKMLSSWAEYIIDKKIDRHGPCNLFSFRLMNYVEKTTVQKLYYEMNENVQDTKEDHMLNSISLKEENFQQKYDKWIDENFSPEVVSSIHDFENLTKIRNTISKKQNSKSYREFKVSIK